MELFVINAFISLLEVHLYLVYLNSVLPAFYECLTVNSRSVVDLPVLKPA